MAATTATYAIDGQAPITFNLNGASSQSTGVQFNQIFFQTDQLPAGPHKLNVVYQGNFNTTPLSFSVLLLQNGTSNSSTTTPTSSSASIISSFLTSPSVSASASVSNGADHSSKTGVIVGGVVASLIVSVCFAILVCFLLRRRNKYNSHERPIGQTDRTGHYDYESTTASSRINQHIPSHMSNVEVSPSNVILPSNRLFLSIPLSRTSDQSSSVVSPFTLAPATNLTGASEARSTRLASHAETAQIHQPNPSGSRKIFEARQQERQVEPPRSDHALPTIMRDADSGIRLHDNGSMAEMLPPAYTAA